MDEQSFPMVMEMLNYAEGAKRTATGRDRHSDGGNRRPDPPARGIFQRLPPLPAHAGGQGACLLLACRVIINDLLGKLYRYDYNVGYDCLLDDGNSVSRKLKKSNEEMEVEEDAPCDR